MSLKNAKKNVAHVKIECNERISHNPNACLPAPFAEVSPACPVRGAHGTVARTALGQTPRFLSYTKLRHVL